MSELAEYYEFTAPARLNKAINMLRGLVAGINADGIIVKDEVIELANWCTLNADLQNKHPFHELIPIVEAALEDGVLDEDEKADILWLCSHASGLCEYYDDIAGSIQYLNGIAHGLLADRKLNDAEIWALHQWLTDNEFLSGTYPFDELYALTTNILSDGVVTEEERNTLIVALGELVDFRASYNLSEKDFQQLRAKYTVAGICALCPKISFLGKVFALSGEFAQGTRKEIAKKIASLGGQVKSDVSKKTDYLIVGGDGNPCWAFACYGRKIEAAIQLRKTGAKVVIVSEADFWDAVLDVEAGIS